MSCYYKKMMIVLENLKCKHYFGLISDQKMSRTLCARNKLTTVT